MTCCTNAYGYGLFTGGLGAHAGAEKLGCTVVPVSGGMTERQVRLIADFGPRVIMVTPSYMLAIVDEMVAQGIDPRSTSLEVGIFGAEPWTNQMRREIEDVLGIDAVDIYGLSAAGGAVPSGEPHARGLRRRSGVLPRAGRSRWRVGTVVSARAE